MATASNLQRLGPAWCGRAVACFDGMHDTHIETGEDYGTLTLAAIFTLDPQDKGKGEGRAFIPSRYADFDARNHAAQRERGSFVALTGDIDGGNHPIEHVQSLVKGFAGECAFLIYSSAHARPGDMRWRVVLPLEAEQPFAIWHDAQNAFFDYMDASGVEMDRALDRAAQPVYLPNVPAQHGKTGESLRGEDGAPLYYARATTGTHAPGLPLSAGPIATYLAAIRRKRAEDERERERIRAAAEERRANSPTREGAAIIEDFNASTSIETLFELYGYERSPRNADDWRSPNQTGQTYATRIFGDKWISLSGSDAAHRVGEPCKSGCFGDAYDLFVHYEHGGDHKSAFRALYSERRAASMAPATPPPPTQEGDPGWTDVPEDFGEDPDAEPVIDPPEAATDLETVDAFDFDEGAIPTRPWIIPGVILGGYTHMLAAPGGSGKSLFTLQLAITLARGDRWGTFVPRRRCRTLIINVEDDLDEQRRRLAAARTVMRGGDELRGMIDIVPNSTSIVVAGRSPDGRSIVTTPVVDTLARYIIDNGIDVLIVDPFAETFEGDENDNSEVKWAMKIWRDEIARRTGAAVYLVHHTTKYAANGAGDANVIRGAGAIVNSTRISATLMPMTAEDADMIGIDQGERHLYVRYDDAKANQSLKTNNARWFQKVSVEIANGGGNDAPDEVGALVPWIPPEAFDGLTGQVITTILDKIEAGMPDGQRYTAVTQGGAKETGRWVGSLIMAETGLAEGLAKKVIKTWVGTQVLVTGEYHDPVKRKKMNGLFAPHQNRPKAPE